MNSSRKTGRLLGEVRRGRILEWLREEGSARVSVLARALAVSEVTVRQDLEKLEAEGHIVREHGGAFLKSVPTQVRAMALQQSRFFSVVEPALRTTAAWFSVLPLGELREALRGRLLRAGEPSLAGAQG